MAPGYPLNLTLEGRKCLVIGSGAEGLLRARNLLEVQAEVYVVGDEPSAELTELVEQTRLTFERRRFQKRDLDGAWLVVQTTQDAELAATLGKLCETKRIFFCAVDQPENSSFSHLALARAGALTFAIGTEGRAPALGRKLREELERVLGEANAEAELERLAELREATPPEGRREILSAAVADVHFTGSLRFRKE
jgi:precorrin-2 dehydrogenase/sirohydrochlorin ferrochelatase